MAPPLVFITGASSGIGQALALHYARSGWQLALVVRKEVETKDWLNAYKISPECYRIYLADIAQIDSIVAAGQAAISAQGLPDVVIANAGISVGVDTAIRSDLQIMANTFATNNLGMAATFHPFLAEMIRRGHGTLVGMTSVAGIRGLPGHGAYCASKAAAISYCESLRGELRGTGVSVVTLLPGYVDTPLTRGNRYPMPFLMKPEIFAEEAVRAISVKATYRVIPWQMGWIAKLLRLLPNAMFDRLLAGRPRKRRLSEHHEN